MTRGDLVNVITSIANNATYDIKPAGGITWSVHNIMFAGNITVSIYDGVNLLTFATVSGSGILANLYIGVSNSVWIQIKNNASGAAKLYAFDAIVSSP